MTRKDADPLAQLENRPRTIGPKQLTGKQKETWERFVKKYKNTLKKNAKSNRDKHMEKPWFSHEKTLKTHGFQDFRTHV